MNKRTLPSPLRLRYHSMLDSTPNTKLTCALDITRDFIFIYCMYCMFFTISPFPKHGYPNNCLSFCAYVFGLSICLTKYCTIRLFNYDLIVFSFKLSIIFKKNRVVFCFGQIRSRAYIKRKKINYLFKFLLLHTNKFIGQTMRTFPCK